MIAEVGRGIYTIVEEPRPHREDGLGLATAALRDTPHYVSWRSALAYHELTEQEPKTITVATRERRFPRRIGELRVQPVLQSPERFYGYRKTKLPAGSTANIASPEKAIIDSLDRPDLVGGLNEAVKALGRTWAYDPDELVKAAKRFPSKATVARLGYLMNRLGIGDPGALRGLVRRKSEPVLLDLLGDEPLTKPDSEWRVADNVGQATLREWASQ